MSIELQMIDCNCNDCKHLVRDFEKFKKWEDWNRNIQLNEFEKQKAKAIQEAQFVIDNAYGNNDAIKSGEGMLRKATKMQFQFNRDSLMTYGNCTKLKKPLCFIPAICQIETQQCFEHRKL